MSFCGDEGLLTELQAFEHMGRGNMDGSVLISEFKDPLPSGNLEVPAQGYYTFYITGAGSIYVDNHYIVEGAPGTENNNIPSYGIIALTPGLHQLDLKGTDDGTRLLWSGPGLKRTEFILNK